MDSLLTGDICEMEVTLALLRAEYEVLKPLRASSRYDLAIIKADKVLKIQCKAGSYHDGVVTFKTCSIDNVSQQRRGYSGDADYFGVYCDELKSIYFVPVDQVGITECYLRVDPTKNGQTKNIRWAKDYLVID